MTMAEQVLCRNEINLDEYPEAVRVLLHEGRGKYRNILLAGLANCGKTFSLNPLNSVFKSFCNPATTTVAWVGADSAEVIFLNDFRWCPQIIPWHDLLLLLEGQKCIFLHPKLISPRMWSFHVILKYFVPARKSSPLVMVVCYTSRNLK